MPILQNNNGHLEIYKYTLNKGSFVQILLTILLITITTQASSTSVPKLRDAYNINRASIHINELLEYEKQLKELVLFDEKEIDCLAINIYFEARSESLEGQAAVAWVTLNRRDAEGFRDTTCKVVYQRWKNPEGVYICQFSWYCDTQSDYPLEKEAYAIAYAIAKDIYYHVDSFTDITKGATFYHADYVTPYWAKSFELVTTIGRHMFYKG